MSATDLRPPMARDIVRDQRRRFFRRLRQNRMVVVGGGLVLFLLITAILGPVIVQQSPYEISVADRLQGPSTAHPMGTDELGRDLASRLVQGARTSMSIGLAVATITGVVGTFIGLFAAYYRFLDGVLMRIMDGLMAFPSILLAIALMTAFGAKTSNVILALCIVFTPYIARVVRSSAIRVKEELYIEAIKSQGATDFRVIFLHIAPNALPVMVVQATFIFADSIVTEAALSFLGAGVPAPEPSWGSILYDSKLVMFESPWMTVAAGTLVVMAVLGLNLLGDGLRDLLDPHTARRSKKGRVRGRLFGTKTR